MFEGTFKKFTCDNCGAEKFVKTWPRSWVCVRKGGEMAHYCFACQTPEEVAAMNKSRDRLRKLNPNVQFFS